jgi:hypothetical protein
MLLVMMALCAGLFWGRFDGLFERFRLLEQYDFGWPVPLLSPEGWLGLVRNTALQAWPWPVRLGLSTLVTVCWLAGVLLLWPRRRAYALAALALTLPVLGGWSLLAWEAQSRANASYDAYKLLGVFYPGLLLGLTCGLAAPVRPALRRLALGLALLALAANVHVAWQFARQMAEPPLRVDRSLLELRRLERMPRVTSLNLRIEDFWSRLWANALLLRKPQYFSVHTYEGRLNSPLRGAWDLSDSLLRSWPMGEDDRVEINAQFHAVRARAPGQVVLAFGRGWHPLEGTGPNRWRWSEGPAVITIVNPASESVKVSLTLRVRPLQKGRLQLELGDARLGASRALNGTIQRLEYRDVILPSGPSSLVLLLDQPVGRADSDDPRQLSLALYGLTVQAAP